jgi:hypothetical protein
MPGAGSGASVLRNTKAAALDGDIQLEDLAGAAGGGAGGADSLAGGLAGRSDSSAQGAIDPSRWLGKEEPKTITEADKEEVDNDGKAAAAAAAEGGAEEYLDMYWMDAFELNGSAYVFGKVALKPATADNSSGADSPSTPSSSSSAAAAPIEFVSCCVVVKGLMRSMFVLPNELPSKNEFGPNGKLKRYDWGEVHKEVNSLLVPACLPRGSGSAFKCKVVKRKYAFEDLEIPRDETEYLKVVYPAVHPPPPLDGYACGTGKVISKIMGAQTTPLEHFMIKRKLMGPGWIRIKKPVVEGTNASWCKVSCSYRTFDYFCVVVEVVVLWEDAVFF